MIRRFYDWFDKRFHVSQEPPGWIDTQWGYASNAGVQVNEENSLMFVAVYACIRILAETVASLPLPIYRRRPDGGKERATDHYLYPVLHDLSNPEMTSFEFREVLMGHVLSWGNAYAQIISDQGGRVIELWPLRPDRMSVARLAGRLIYTYRLAKPDAQNRTTRTFLQEEILHIRGLGFDGMVGYSPIQVAMQAIGLGMAAEEFGARFFANDARPGVVLEHPGKLSDKAMENLRKTWEERHQGASRASKTAILEEGMKVHEVGLPPATAQFLETRKFQVTEIARLYRVPPHMLADLERATFSNIEHQSLEFVIHTVRPWLVRWEQAISRSLLAQAERSRYFAEFLVDGLLRGDIQSRYAAYATARQNGWMSANDVRRLENMNPIADGDVYLIPLNMIPAGSTGALDQQQERALLTGGQQRAARNGAISRHRLAVTYRQVYKDTAARILRREVNDVRAAAQKILGRRDWNQFQVWLAEFYSEHQEFIRRQMSPVLNSYAELVAADAAQEVGADEQSYRDGLERWLGAYLNSYARRHAAKSEYKITNAVQRAQNDGNRDPLADLEAELDDWEEARSEQIANEESTRSGNAVTKFVFMAAGIISIMSVAFGDNCPYCDYLDGAIIGIEQEFIPANGSVAPEGLPPLTSASAISHPPYHDGCDCGIVAV